MSEVVKIIEKLLRPQTGFNLKIHRELEGLKTLNNLTKDVFMEHRDTIKRLCHQDELEGEIATVRCETTRSREETRSETQSSSLGRSGYQDLSLMARRFEDDSEVRNSSNALNRNSHVLTTPLKPLMRAPSFIVRAMEDKFVLKNFLAYFENYVVCVGSKAARFQ